MSIKSKLLELKNTRAGLLKEAETALESGDMETHKAKMDAAKGYNDRIQAAEDLMAEQERYGLPTPEEKAGNPQLGDGQGDSWKMAVKSFAAAARAGFKVSKAQGDALQEGQDVDGGYTVPDDIVGAVEKFRDAEESLLSLVTIKRVKKLKGARTFKKRKQHKGFSTVAEMGKIPKVEGPEFTRIEYNIEKRAGFLPVTDELLEDSDADIAQEAVEWLGGEARVTANTEIVNVVKAKGGTDLKTIDDILNAWIKLGTPFRRTSSVITNDSGLMWLVTQKDKNDRPLLQPNPAHPEKLQLCVGPFTIPVVSFDDDTIPNEDTKVPFIIGDLKEGVIYWDRRKLTLTMSKVAVAGDFNAFEQDMTLWKGTMRDDCVERDGDAYVYGQVDTAGVGG